MPKEAMRSQPAAASAATGSAASARVNGPAKIWASSTSSPPVPSASQDAWTPSATAAVRSPAPKRRAARPVVPYAISVPNQTATDITVPPTATAARGTRPRWPTTAVSTSTYSGSAARTTRAGSARAAMRRERVPWSTAAGGLMMPHDARPTVRGATRPNYLLLARVQGRLQRAAGLLAGVVGRLGLGLGHGSHDRGPSTAGRVRGTH
jgi:hypothetical protein